MASVASIGALLAVFRATLPNTVAFSGNDNPPGFEAPALTFPALLELYTGTRLTAGNRVEPLLNGDETYPRLWSDLRSARKTITVQSYYARPGSLSDTLSKILRQRARAGVHVRLLFDAFGSEAMPARWYDQLRRDGVRAAVLRPLHWYNLHGGADRSHVRAIVVDGRVGYTGGFGFADYWQADDAHEAQWRETNVRVEGPAALQLQAAFGTAWLEATGELLTGPRFFDAAAGPTDSGTAAAGLLFTTTTTGSTAAERFLALALLSARQRLWITNSYFVPTADLRRLLVEAAARGVDVRLLTADSRSDVKTTWYAARHHYEELLRAGIRIYEYGAAMMHAKTLVVDGEWAAIGSMNLDNRSLAFNDESTLIARDSTVARHMEDVFGADLDRATEVTLAEFRRRPMRARLVERAASLLASLL